MKPDNLRYLQTMANNMYGFKALIQVKLSLDGFPWMAFPGWLSLDGFPWMIAKKGSGVWVSVYGLEPSVYGFRCMG